MTKHTVPLAAKWCAALAGASAAAYAAYVATTWLRYGRTKADADTDPWLETFIPQYDVALRHEVEVRAPAAVAFATACAEDLGDSAVISTLFKMRELIFGRPDTTIEVAGGLVDKVRAFGWEILADVPGREVVFGAVTQPWRSDVHFRAVAPKNFASFEEPGFVKIVWTVRADPLDIDRCVVRTETRVATTSADARMRFRWYWSLLSPGIKLIRLAMLAQIKRAAEQHVATRVAAVA
jgi:hypothetical protein